MEIPDGYYRADNGMLKMREAATAPPAAPPAPILTDAQLEALTDDDIRRISRTKLLKILTTSTDEKALLPVIRELLDRVDVTTGGSSTRPLRMIELEFVTPQGTH